jgi:hypothetical protein
MKEAMIKMHDDAFDDQKIIEVINVDTGKVLATKYIDEHEVLATIVGLMNLAERQGYKVVA